MVKYYNGVHISNTLFNDGTFSIPLYNPYDLRLAAIFYSTSYSALTQ